MAIRVGSLATAGAIGAALLTSCSTQVLPGASQCATAPGVTSTHVSYGLIYPDSGTFAQSLTPYRSGVDARLGLANARGGIYGRTVSYQRADDAGQVAPNLAAAQHLVNVDHVFGIQEISTAPMGSAPWLNSQGIPVVGTSNDLVWTKYPNMFSYFNLMTANAGSVSTWGDYARSLGVKKVAILYSPLSDGSRQMGQKFQTSFASQHIQTVMIDANPDSVDVRAVVRTVQDSGSQMITGVIDAQHFITLALAIRAVVPSVKILSVLGYDQQVLDTVGRQLAGMTVFLGSLPFEQPTPAHQVFLDAMATYAPQQQPAANSLALTGWLDADLFLRGLQAAGRCPTRQSYITSLRKVTDYTAGGLLTAPVNMSAIFGKLTTCYSFLQISPDGRRFVPVGHGPLCGARLP